MTIRYLSSDWPGIFRVQMLHLMPPAIFLKDFFNLTIPQTVERYLKLFAANDLAGVIFHRVTSALIDVA